MKRYGLLVWVLLLAACATQATETPAPPSPTAPPGPSPTPTPTPTATPSPTATPIPSATPGVGSVQQGGNFSNWMGFGALAVYTLDAHVGDAVRVSVAPDAETLDLRLSVKSPGEYEVAIADRGGPGEPEVLAEFQFPLDGRYEVIVAAVDGEGMMRGNLAFLPPEARTGGGAFAGFDAAPIRARIDAPGVYHVYTFDAPAGLVAQVQAVAADPDLDLYFHLFQPDGTRFSRFDDELPPHNPALHDRQLPQAGRYTVLVGARAGTGAYEMTLAQGG